MSEPLVSVIVPIYNTEEYLSECVESIIHQTYENLEIILVDDGSAEPCRKLCDEYEKKDSRIVVIHKENGGASKAREVGILAAKGQYLMFVDSDDWLDLETIKKCVEVAEANKSECVLFGYIKEYAGTQLLNPLFENDIHYVGAEVKEKIHRRLIGFRAEELTHPEKIDNLSPLWGKLYKTEVAKKGRIISEREVGTSEDTIFNIYAMEGCKSVSYINCCLYHYRKSNAQAMTMTYKPDLYQKWKRMYQFLEEYIKMSGKQEFYEEPFMNRVACGMIGLGINEATAKHSILQKRNNIKKILDDPLYERAFRQLNDSYCQVKWKVFFFLCKCKYTLFLTIMLEIVNYVRLKHQ